jgi:hypothetical protein
MFNKSLYQYYMGTAQATFEGVLPEMIVCACATVSNVTWLEVTSPEVTSVTGTRSMFCACATGNCAISALVGPFD